MKFAETPLRGAYLIEPTPISDARGLFARAFCRHEFEEHGLDPDVSQCNISYNVKRGTLRGMHFQRPPHQETKLVRCTTGAVYDAIIDLRPESPSYCKWYGVELTPENRLMLYVPKGFAHGYQTLVDGSEVFYQVSDFYHAGADDGVRWNDPAFSIHWPIEVAVISEKDKAFSDFANRGTVLA